MADALNPLALDDDNHEEDDDIAEVEEDAAVTEVKQYDTVCSVFLVIQYLKQMKYFPPIYLVSCQLKVKYIRHFILVKVTYSDCFKLRHSLLFNNHSRPKLNCMRFLKGFFTNFTNSNSGIQFTFSV